MHPWDLSPSEAVRLQRELASRVVGNDDADECDVKLIAGSDVAFDKPNGRAIGAIVVLDYPSLDVVERLAVESPVTFPYVPGLLSFRETPLLLPAFERLRHSPDLLMVDGHGYAHPRRFGFACHLGLTLDLPTIGVAKSRLFGAADIVAGPSGSRADLVDDGEVIGSMLRTRQGVRSIYVSIGHRVSLATADRWALACASKYRVPEPTRLADRLAGEAKRRMVAATLEMVIEQRAGERGRWEWVREDDSIVYRHDLDPMPSHYGCSSEIMNPADGELLDIMLIDDRPRQRGERVLVQAIDVLRRTDGDDKLLAFPIDRVRPPDDEVVSWRERIWAWCVALGKPVVDWGGEDAALALIEECRS